MSHLFSLLYPPKIMLSHSFHTSLDTQNFKAHEQRLSRDLPAEEASVTRSLSDIESKLEKSHQDFEKLSGKLKKL